MRTPEEIQRQIEGLKAMKTWLPEHNFFGDNNWEGIDDQISILDGTSDYEELLHEYDAEEKDSNDIYNADAWLNGDYNDDLFEERED